nr:LysR substrate-binding domain-containing protein [Pseudochelatococcus lubricantis]
MAISHIAAFTKNHSGPSRLRPPSLSKLPPLTALRTFVVVARELSFKNASDKLYVTPAAVGMQIRALEDHLGAQLFVRDGNRLQITEIGEALYPYLEEAFHLISDGVEHVTRIAVEGPLRVSVTPSFAYKWLVPRLAGLRSKHPDLEIQLDSSLTLGSFSDDNIDCAIRFSSGICRNLASELILSESIVPVCSPSLHAKIHNLSIGEIVRTVPLIHDDSSENEDGSVSWGVWLGRHGVGILPGDSGPHFNLSALAIDAAVAGMGIALAKSRLAQADLDAGRLVVPFGETAGVNFSYYFVTTKQKSQIRRVQTFRKWLKSEALHHSPAY